MSGYSHSQISTYLTCPLKYKYDKIDNLGRETKETSLSLILGTAVHAALEFLYKQRTNLKTPAREQVLQRYTLTFTKECEEATTEFLAEEIETFTHRGQVYLQRYRSTYFPFDQAITMAVEESVKITFTDQISFTGYIDRLDVSGDNITIIDYKTSKKLEPDDADIHRQQLTLYAQGIRQKYGSKFTTIHAKLIYVHLEKEVARTVSAEEMDTVAARYLDYAQQIETAKARLANYPEEVEQLFPAQVGSHCSYCPFQMICPKRKHQFMDDEVVSSDLGENTIRKLLDEYAVLQKKMGALEKEKKTISEILIQYAKEKQLPVLYGNESKASVTSRTYRSVHAEHEQLLRQYAKDHGLEEVLLKIDTNALATLIQQQQIDLDTIAPRVSSKESSRLISSKKKS